MNTIPIQDILGREIKAGCIIVYGHALGRCAALKIGKVLKVKAEDKGPLGIQFNN